jgi:hypothetical protein
MSRGIWYAGSKKTSRYGHSHEKSFFATDANLVRVPICDFRNDPIHASALYALFIIPQEHVFLIEANNTMDSSRILARLALAELFDELKPQKAHWYSIKAPTTKDPYSDRIDRLFPSLGTLLSLTMEIMNFVLEASALMRWKDKKSGSPLRA